MLLPLRRAPTGTAGVRVRPGSFAGIFRRWTVEAVLGTAGPSYWTVEATPGLVCHAVSSPHAAPKEGHLPATTKFTRQTLVAVASILVVISTAVVQAVGIAPAAATTI